jgi:hypothetical protein
VTSRICAAENWKHICHLRRGHHGPHYCSEPGDTHGCDFHWPNENEIAPCPSSQVAVLGAVEASRLRCGLADGHMGSHEFSLTWESTE